MAVNMKRLRTMDDVPFDGRRVLVRVDFNVSVGKDGLVDEFEDYRIEAALPTIQELMQRRCRVLLLTHHGRMGEDAHAVDLQPIHRRLEELLKEEVKPVKQLYGEEVEVAASSMEPGTVALMPNIRMDEREIIGSEKFAHDIAQHVDMYINEAFSACHRAHTSLTFLPRLMPNAAGRRTVIEVEALGRLRENPKRPYVVIASGAKISTKVGMLRTLLSHVDTLCLGGRIANIFLAAKGVIDDANYHGNDLAAAQALLELAADKIVLPEDVVVGDMEGEQGVQIVPADQVPQDAPGLYDIGPKAAERIVNVCRTAQTVMWNGPVGLHEVPAYAGATKAIAEGLADLAAYRVVGGGDTVNAIERHRLTERFDHVSVGGGAMIAFLEDKRMPGLEPLYE